jgi:plastocyanin
MAARAVSAPAPAGIGRFLPLAAAAAAIVVFTASPGTPGTQGTRTAGVIRGRVRLSGRNPGNAVIRMGLDPGCTALNEGRRVVQEVVLTGPDGGLANVFVALEGTFPRTPAPATPVVIDQRGCVYQPRVVGARAGQMLEVRNSDPLLHNVHSRSSGPNAFNVGQPQAGVVSTFRLEAQPGMLRLACDVHRWMTAFVGVVDHPYFAVTGTDGAFQLAGVPPGTYRIRAWHERYGDLSQSVRVGPEGTAAVSFAYEEPDRVRR